MRKLVTLRQVKEILPIEGADKVELAKIDGWQCVVKKDEFKSGSFGLYFEIDSLLPADDPRFAFMAQRKFRVKTIKLRGQLSQGLLMPRCIQTEEEFVATEQLLLDEENPDLSQIMRVTKYEPPLPIGGKQSGLFPHFVRKTDQERIQNISNVLSNCRASEFEITEKLDGTSCTIFYIAATEGQPAKFGVCSRNFEMQLDDDNAYVFVAKKNNLQAKLEKLGRNLAIQGEIIGPKVQGNRYGLHEQQLFVFDIFDIDKQKYLLSDECQQLVADLGLQHVPLALHKADWDLTLDSVLTFADGNSELNPKTIREGLVFKAKVADPNGRRLTFKAISNQYLLKYE